MILALLMLGPVVLRNDTSTIPPNHRWRYDRFVTTAKQLPVDVDCTYRVLEGGHVRLELMSEDNLEALRRGRKYETIQVSKDGSLHQEIGVPGTFAIVVWNDDEQRPAEVAIRLALDFSGKSLNPPRTLSTQRKLTVILLSFVGFILIVTLSARVLLNAMKAHSLTSFHTPDAPGSIPPTPDRGPGYKQD
jgi:hypothetical protein